MPRRLWLSLWLGAMWVAPSLSGADITKWTTEGTAIKVQVNDAQPQTFFAVGMCYAPAPIGDGGDGGLPFQDFFFYNPGDPNSQWGYIPIWERDIGTTAKPGHLRQMGVNSIRVYSMFKHGYTDNTGRELFDQWKSLDWSTNPPPVANWWTHHGHERFLDMCWNNGENPIYVLIGVPFSEAPFGFSTNPQEAQKKQDAYEFFLHTAEWLAERYGSHPAVMGFILGNEHDAEAGLSPQIPPVPPEHYYGPEYTMNYQNQPLRKLSDTEWEGMPAGNYWRTTYHDKLNNMVEAIKKHAPDKLVTSAWHDKQYFASHWLAVPDDEKKTIRVIDEDVLEYSKLDFFSFNIYRSPQDTLRDLNERYLKYAEKYGKTELIRPIMFTELGIPASRRVNGEAVELENNAQAQGDRLVELWKDGISNRVDSSGPYPYLSGMYTFSYVDEWFKYKNGSITRQDGGGSAEGSFPGGHWDEEWFGIFKAEANPKRLPGPKVTANPHYANQNDQTPLAERPVISDFGNGNLNGGADVLTPRAAVEALTNLYAEQGVGYGAASRNSLQNQGSAPAGSERPNSKGRTPGVSNFLDH